MANTSHNEDLARVHGLPNLLLPHRFPASEVVVSNRQMYVLLAGIVRA